MYSAVSARSEASSDDTRPLVPTPSHDHRPPVWVSFGLRSVAGRAQIWQVTICVGAELRSNIHRLIDTNMRF